MSLNSMQDLFLEQLAGMYDAELQLVDALPEMAKAASSMTLSSAFEQHLVETQAHVTRLEDVFRMLGETAERKACKAMEGLVEEGNDIIDSDGNDAVRDAALIAGAQRVEHYEISAYGTLRELALVLGRPDVVTVLERTLSEEQAADTKLNRIAEDEVNVKAAGVTAR